MIAECMNRRGLAWLASACGLAVVVVACGSGDLLVGDDARDAAVITNEGGPMNDGAAPVSSDAAKDVTPDAPPEPCTSAPGGPGMCLPKGTACNKADTTGLTCPSSGSFCCITACPELAQPPPGFCDGGPYAPTYNANACINGFACTPVACTAAGGTCVGLSPSSCPNGHLGDGMKYSCGAGVGVACCLPGS